MPRAYAAHLQRRTDDVEQQEHTRHGLELGRIGIGQQRRTQRQACRCFSDRRDHMEQEGDRIAQRFDIRRSAAQHLGIARHPGNAQHQQGDDTQRMRLAETAMLEDAESREAGQYRGPDIDPAQGGGRDNFLVTEEGDQRRRDGHQADEGVDHTQVS